MLGKNSRIQNIFFKQVSIAPLIVFRVIFGALMLFGTLRFVAKGWVSELYIKPSFHFTYLGFDWVKVLPGNWMYLPFILLFLSSIGIILGAFYRFSAILFFLLFTYIELIDKTYYLNHYYFVSLIAFLMIFLPAHNSFSVDSYRKKTTNSFVPAWTIWILKFQLACVYFFAGLAKINSDWLLEAQPLKIWLQAYRDLPFVGWIFASTFTAFFFSWFGCIYDLTIPFFLSFQKTRKYAYFFVIVFHILTWILFPIGVFPWVMIFSTLIFFPSSFHEKMISFISRNMNIKKQAIQVIQYSKSNFIVSLISIYIFLQLLIPFRYLLYPGNLFWTEEGFRFSWRVMLMHKEGMATFYVKDKKTKGEIEIDNNMYLTPNQIDQMSTQADFILQYAHFLKDKFKDTLLVYSKKQFHLKNPSVHVESFVSLNGRPHQLFVNKKHDLSKYSYNLAHRKWVERF